MLWPSKHGNCTDTHTHTYLHTHTHTRTHSHLVSQPLERVDAVLSAELLEVLRDGVCGGQETSSEQGRGRANTKHSYCFVSLIACLSKSYLNVFRKQAHLASTLVKLGWHHNLAKKMTVAWQTLTLNLWRSLKVQPTFRWIERERKCGF